MHCAIAPCALGTVHLFTGRGHSAIARCALCTVHLPSVHLLTVHCAVCTCSRDLLWNLRVVLSVWYPVPQPGLTFTQQFESLIQLDQDIYHYVSAGFHLWARTTCIHWEVLGPQWEDACFFCPTIYHRNCLSTPHPSPFVFLPFPSPDQNIYLDRNAISIYIRPRTLYPHSRHLYPK